MLLLENGVSGACTRPCQKQGQLDDSVDSQVDMKILPRRTVQNLTAEHLARINEVEKLNREEFAKKRFILGNSIHLLPEVPDPRSLSEDDDEVIGDLGPSIFGGE